MFTKLIDTTKASIFSVLVLFMATGVALLIRILDLAPNLGMWILWSCTPTVAALIMLLAVTREGYSKEGWKLLGLHRLGLGVWWIAFGGTLLISVAASAIVWATPLASFVVPDYGIGGASIDFAVEVVFATLTLSLGEELGWRGYLLPRLLSMGLRRALVLVGLIWAAWHMPLIFLTPLYHAAGNKVIVLPLFVGTIVAASFFFGYLRVWTGSVWPASIGHSAHNAAWNALEAFTVTSNPVVVNEYLAGDNGILILVGTAVGAVWLGRKVGYHPGTARPPVGAETRPRVR